VKRHTFQPGDRVRTRCAAVSYYGKLLVRGTEGTVRESSRSTPAGHVVVDLNPARRLVLHADDLELAPTTEPHGGVMTETFQPGDSVRYLGAVGTDGEFDGLGGPNANRLGMFGGRVYTVARLTRDGYLVFAGVADSWHPSRFELVARRPASAPEPEEEPMPETFQPGDRVRRTGRDYPIAEARGMLQGRVYTVETVTASRGGRYAPGGLTVAGIRGSWDDDRFELVARRPAPAPEPEERGTLPTTPGSAVLVRSWSGEFAFGAYVLRHDGLWYGGKYGRRADDPGVGPEILRADYLCTVLHDEGAANG
jgi:hypothetical protein